MCTSPHIETEVWRLIIVRRKRSELLASGDEPKLSLPSVELPKWHRIVEVLNPQVKALWNLDTLSLYALPSSTSAHYHVAEALHSEDSSLARGLWVPISSLTEARFAKMEDFTAIGNWLATQTHGQSNDTDEPFAKSGWFTELSDWARGAIRPFGLQLTGNFLQLDAGPFFSLIRFEADHGAVWFKAVGPRNTPEFVLTTTLSDLFPAHLPRILAIHPLSNGWLAEDVPGVRLDESRDPRTWRCAAKDLAALQVASIEATDRLLQSGAHDVRCDTVLLLTEPFFASLAELMDAQTTSPPARLSIHQLQELASLTRKAVLYLKKGPLPDTLGHLDLNPGNIIRQPDRTVFLDWAEACVGHPFSSAAYLLEHFRKMFPSERGQGNCLLQDYLSGWRAYAPLQELRKMLRIASFLAVFVHGANTDTWRNPEKLKQPRMAGYFRSLARRMKRDGEKLQADGDVV